MTARTFLLSLPLALPGLLLSAGCADAVKAPIQSRNDPYPHDQVHIASMDLRRHTAVAPPILRRDDAGLLHVTVPVRAATNLTLHVDYRVTFVDQTGGPISQTGWMQKTLSPNIPDEISFNSTSPRAADFQMDLRYSE